MRIEVLTRAKEHLFDGYLFHEFQESSNDDYLFPEREHRIAAPSSRPSNFIIVIGGQVPDVGLLNLK